MSNIIRIDLELSVQKFEIAGKEYEINYNDEKLKVYQKETKKFYDEMEELNKNRSDKLTEKEELEIENTYYSSIKNIVDMFFGEGSYDELYEKTGKSIFVIMKIIEAVYTWMADKFAEVKKEDKAYYTKK